MLSHSLHNSGKRKDAYQVLPWMHGETLGELLHLSVFPTLNKENNPRSSP